MIALNGGRPEMLNLKDFLTAFVDFREEVVTRRTKFRLAKARAAAHVQVGLAIAVANIDEVIRLIRTSPDTGAAREALMARDWPALDMAPLITLIADPAPHAERGRHLSPVRDAGPRHPGIAPRPPDGARPRRDRRGPEQARGRDRRPARHPRLARAHLRDHPRRARSHQAGPCDAAPDRDPRQRRRHGGRGPHRPRGHGHHGQPCRLREARAALDLPGAAPRRQGPVRDADARRGLRGAHLRGQHPPAAAVLLLARPSLQDEGVASAARRPPGARQGPGEPAAAGTGRAHHHHHAAAGGRARLGRPRRRLRDHARHGAAQQAVATSPRSTARARSP